jgi:hypothetical protein
VERLDIVAAVGITSGVLTYDIDKAIIIMVALITIVTYLVQASLFQRIAKK